jgi:glycerate-2-kinase
MISRSADVSQMNLDWVEHTEDVLFRNLSKSERLLLYYTFVLNMEINVIKSSLECEAKEVRTRLAGIIRKIKEKAKLELKEPLEEPDVEQAI